MNTLTKLVIVVAIALVAIACEQDHAFPTTEKAALAAAWQDTPVSIIWTTTPPDEKIWTYYQPAKANDDNSANGSCPFGNCSTIIPSLVAVLQQQANRDCQDLFYALECCVDGQIAYALLVVLHTCDEVNTVSPVGK